MEARGLAEDALFALKRAALFNIIEAPSIEEATQGGAVNFVALGPRKILMAAGNPLTRKALEAEGVEVHVIDISEIQKGWGGLHCMTAFLKRVD